jgi:hypothetical protein
LVPALLLIVLLLTFELRAHRQQAAALATELENALSHPSDQVGLVAHITGEDRILSQADRLVMVATERLAANPVILESDAPHAPERPGLTLPATASSAEGASGGPAEAAGAPVGGCGYTAPLPASFIGGCDNDCKALPNEAAALLACSASSTCGGVTRSSDQVGEGGAGILGRHWLPSVGILYVE